MSTSNNFDIFGTQTFLFSLGFACEFDWMVFHFCNIICFVSSTIKHFDSKIKFRCFAVDVIKEINYDKQTKNVIVIWIRQNIISDSGSYLFLLIDICMCTHPSLRRRHSLCMIINVFISFLISIVESHAKHTNHEMSRLVR